MVDIGSGWGYPSRLQLEGPASSLVQCGALPGIVIETFLMKHHIYGCSIFNQTQMKTHVFLTSVSENPWSTERARCEQPSLHRSLSIKALTKLKSQKPLCSLKRFRLGVKLWGSMCMLSSFGSYFHFWLNPYMGVCKFPLSGTNPHVICWWFIPFLPHDIPMVDLSCFISILYPNHPLKMA